MVYAHNDEKRCSTDQTRESPSPRSSSGHLDASQPDSEMRTARNSYNEDLDGKTEVGLSPVRHAHHFGYRQEYLSPEHLRATINARLANPLAGFTQQQLSQRGEDFALKYGMLESEDVRAFRLGAMLAQDSTRYAAVEELTSEERTVFEREITHKWSLPWSLIIVIVLCSFCAGVQGMDETVINGSHIFFAREFGISNRSSARDTWLLGLVNAAPYLCCATIGCWLTIPFNNWWGRKGTIIFSCVISAATCIWQSFTTTWWHLLIARFFLGLGIGPKSATSPIYAAECSPPSVRGALVMQWQLWTAFGLMAGLAADLCLYYVPDSSGIVGLNWRLMMASPCLPAMVVICFGFLCPESPRWYMSKGKVSSAYRSMVQLRFNKVQAARDIFHIHTMLEAEKTGVSLGQSKFKEMFTVPRNRRAMQASEILMFMQQFCGVNVIGYYSSAIFLKAGFSEISALGASLGWGAINFIFAIPAIYTIDTYGRRKLLLITFPLMSLCLFFIGSSFWISGKAQIACVALGIYLFGVCYSPGASPVPFTYSAEAYPLYIRAEGMSLATSTTWFFNFLLAVTWPSLLKDFKHQGAFAFYAVWNVIGFMAVLFLVPETKGKSLEELDQVFSVGTKVHAAYRKRQFVNCFRRCILGQEIEPEKLYCSSNGEPQTKSLSQEMIFHGSTISHA
ncbi:MFS sugar transporter/MFS domain sugar transporter [Blumeria hordei DH14]|uniref:MFS sugar transporter/MFS domain sugar transporter n=1 Tax=Blumeria graminis f. sp. hordei (strain DH14) TaxID=546991 RepID=N1J9S0_BLUG1|nr:MFS sugar transporter/MFS domain sugar transporter [Blumeria hordei DH14]